ncbi:MAG: patatin-like phospholipase family protein [Bacteroidia bacterium]|nr:patatin-like phospholipase family protein [Bacteroidia bacterium]
MNQSDAVRTLLPKFRIVAAAGLMLGAGCSPKLHPVGGEFIRLGMPEPDLSRYRSPQDRPGQDPDLAVAMAISGGGARSYNYAFGILQALEADALLREIDYYSAVSGGCFAPAAYFAAQALHRQQGGAGFRLSGPEAAWIREALAHNYEWPVARAWLSPRFWFSRLNAGDALERDLHRTLLRGQPLTLGHCYRPPDSPAPAPYPVLLANATLYQPVGLFPFTPDLLDTFQVSGYTHQLRRIRQDTPIDPYSLPLSVAIRASGTFPVAIPNAVLRSVRDPEYPYLQLFDGGAADNLGHRTAIRVLAQDPAPRKVLLVVDADGISLPSTYSRRPWTLPPKVYWDLALTGINAQRTARRRDIEWQCEALGITPVFLSFDAWLEGHPATMEESVRLRPLRRELIRQLSEPGAALSMRERVLLCRAINAVPTRYRISPADQELLILAAHALVQLKAHELRAAMGQ